MQIRQGIDIISVARMRQAIRRGGKRFLHRIFTVRERSYCEKQRMKYEHYAARFAAKEAVMKILPGPTIHRHRLSEIEILRQATGRPYASIAPVSRRRFGLPKKFQIEISMAHERELAIATAMLILA